MKPKTLTTSLLLIIAMALVPTASASDGDVAESDCDPDEPIDEWLICVINEAVTVPPWVGQLISDVFGAIDNAEAKFCAEYERHTGDPCPL